MAATPQASLPEYPASVKRSAVAMLLAVWLAFNLPALAGKVRFPTDFEGPKTPAAVGERASNLLDFDAYFAVYPWRVFLGESLRDGRIPLWDPHRFAGTPFAANIGTGTWYPFNWAYAIGDFLPTLTILAMLSQMIALLGSYWFFSLLKMHPLAAALGALTFTFSGFFTGWGAHDPVINAVIWLPLALAGAELARRGRATLGIPITGMALALSVLAGHVQFSIYVWMAVALWIVLSAGVDIIAIRGAGRKQILRLIGRGLGTAAASFAIAAGLASIQLLAVAEFSQHIFRQTEPYSGVLESALPYRHLVTILIPDYFGNPADNNYVGPGINYTQLALYMGIATLMLATVGLMTRRDRLCAYFGILGLVGVLAALGTPFYKVLYVLAPGLSRTTHIARFILYIDFSLAGLAALGLDTFLRRREQVRALFWAVPAILAVIGIVGLGLSRIYTTVPRAYLDSRWIRGLLFAVAGAALLAAMGRFPGRSEVLATCLLVVIAADLLVFGFNYHPVQTPRELYRPTPEIRALQQLPGKRPRFAQVGLSTLPFNAAQVFHLYGLSGYDPFLPDTFVGLITAIEDQRKFNQANLVLPIRPENASSSILDLLGVTALLHAKEGSDHTTSWTAAFSITRTDDPLPAAFMTQCWEVVPADRIMGRLQKMTTPELGSVAIIEPHEAAPSSRRPAVGCPPAHPAKILTYEPEKVVIRTQSSARSMLVLTDQWFAGWEATVDGNPAPILKADHTFRALALAPGSHTVEFTFRPRWLRFGVTMTLITTLATGIVIFIAYLRKRLNQ